MPELPEVEVIRQGIQPHLEGRRVISITSSGKNLRRPVPIAEMNSSLSNKTISKVTRRAKYLLLHFSSGPVLILHLGMTGNLGLFPQGSKPAPHDHLFLLLDDSMELRYNDVRRFGAVLFFTTKEAQELESTFFHNTGPEPLGKACTASYLMNRGIGKSQPIKTFLMNAQIIAGIGNIYANESLFRAGIDPQRAARKLLPLEWEYLLHNIQATLTWAIECGGSTIRDYINASGKKGYFQANFKVYGREGKPCYNCSTPIIKTKLGGRATFFCPNCQS